MLKKSHYFFLLMTLMLLLFSVSMVSAADVVDNSTDTTGSILTSETGIGIDNVICGESEETSENTKNIETSEKRLTKQDTTQTSVKTSSYSVNVNNFQELSDAVNDAKKGQFSEYFIYLTSGFKVDNNLEWDSADAKNTKLTIDGNGNTVDGQNRIKFIHIGSGQNLCLNNMNFQYFTDHNVNSNEGGCIDNEGSLTINNCNFKKNYVTAKGNFDDIQGGVIYNYENAFMNINNSLFDDNYVDHNGAIHANGGAIYNQQNARLVITNSVFNNNRAKTNGGALYIKDNSRVTIYDSEFTNNKADKGGAIYLTGSAILYSSNISFQDNTASEGNNLCQEGGTLVNLLDSNVTVHNYNELVSTVKNLEGVYASEITVYLADGDYHATSSIDWDNIANIPLTIYGNGMTLDGQCKYRFIYNHENQELILNNITFTNYTQDYGGVIYNKGRLTVSDCTFRGNHANICGGSIYNNGNAQVTLIHSIFTENDAGNGGVIFNGENANIDITSCEFNINTAKDKGGAIYNTNNAITNIHTSSFSGNNASDGRNIYNDSGTVNIDSLIENVTVNTYEGLVNELHYASTDYCTEYIINLEYGNYRATSTLDFQNKDNIPLTINGNGLILDGQNKYKFMHIQENQNVVVENCIFENFKEVIIASVFENEGNLKVKNCNFNNNNGNLVGAVLTRDNGITNITDSVFEYNRVGNGDGGAALYNMNHAKVTITNSVFNCNDVNYYGGAIFNKDNVKVTISNSKFTNNVASYAGAIFNRDNTTITITNSIFENNNASNCGGIIYNNLIAHVTISNSNFTENSAGDDGGVIYTTDDVLLNISNCNFNNNYAKDKGGVLFNTKDAVTQIADSSFINNSASIGDDIYRESGTVITDFKYDVTVYSYDELVNEINNANELNKTYIFGVEYVINLGSGDYNATANMYFNNNIPLIINGNGITLDGQDKYQFMHIHGGPIYLNDMIFQHFTSDYHEGGCIDNEGGNLSINNCKFKENHIDTGGNVDDVQGGVIYNHLKAFMTINNTLFDDNYVDHNGAIHANGGVIYNQEDTTLIITNSVFNNSRAKTNGGTLYIKDNSQVTIYDSEFTNNNADKGGAIYITGDAVLTLNGRIPFINNTADEGNDIYKDDGTINNYTSRNTVLTINPVSNTILGTNIIFTGKLVDDYGRALNNKTVWVSYNNEEHAVITDNDGEYVYNDIAYNGGVNTVIVNFKDDDYYYTSSANTTFEVFSQGNVSCYDEIISIVQKIKTFNATNFTINLLPGDYNATYNMTWGNAAGSIRKLIIEGNGLTLDGCGNYQFMNVAEDYTLLLNNITLMNYTAYHGAAIANYGKTIINDGTLSNNTATQGGAIYNSNRGTVIINGSYLTDNVASWYDGGAIYNVAGATLNVTDSEFVNNYAAMNGGAIGNHKSYATLVGCIFKDNNATEGGAIYNSDNIVTSLNSIYEDNNPANFIIENNKIILDNNNGYITVDDVVVYVDDLVKPVYVGVLDDFKVPLGKHTIYLLVNGTDTNTFNNNMYILESTSETNILEVYNYEGLVSNVVYAKSLDYNNVTISLLLGDYNATDTMMWADATGKTRSLIIEGNDMLLDGRGIYQFMEIGKGYSLLVKNLTFSNYRSPLYGGVIDNEGGNVGFINCNFNNNVADFGGGAIYNSMGTVTITNGNFTNNFARNSLGYITNTFGGAINNFEGNLDVINCSFMNNAADKGGAIYNSVYGGNSIVNVTLCNVTSNTAQSDGAFIYNEGIVNVNLSSITGNTAGNHGGAIFNYKGSVASFDTVYENNTPSNFEIQDNKIVLSNSDGYITVGIVAIYLDEYTNPCYEGLLDNFIIPMGNHTIYLVVNGTDTDTFKDNIYVLKSNVISDNMGVYDYSSLINTVEYAKTLNYDNVTITLLPGDYNATGNMTWDNATGTVRTLIIDGNNITLDGCGFYQFMKIAKNYNLILNNITLTNYNAYQGAVIENYGKTFISDSTLSNNTATNGGAIYNVAGGTLNVTDSEFVNNYAAMSGGAIYNYDKKNVVTSHNSVFEDNNPANFIVEDDKIVLNQTDGYISVEDVTIYVDDMNSTPYIGDLNDFTVPNGNHTIYMIVNGTDTSIFSDNLYVFTTKSLIYVSVDAINSYVGEIISLTAHVTNEDLPAVGGNVTFLVDDKVLLVDGVACVVPVVDGVASMDVIATSSFLNYTTFSAVYAREGYSSVSSDAVDFNISKRLAGIEVVINPVSQQQYKNVTFTATLRDVTPNHKNNTILYDNSYVVFSVNGELLTDANGNVVHVLLDENGVATFNYMIAPGTASIKTIGSLYDYNVTAQYLSEFYEETSSLPCTYHVEQSPIDVIFNNVYLDNSDVLHIEADILDYMGNHVLGTSVVSLNINGKNYVDENDTLIFYDVKDGIIRLDDIKVDNITDVLVIRLSVLDSSAYLNGANITYLPTNKRGGDNTNNTDNGGVVRHVTVKTHKTYNPAGDTTKTLRTITSTITLHNNMNITLEIINNIFNMNFSNGVLLIYLDGKLVFNGTTSDDLAMILFELVDELLGEHELKVVFTDENNNTQTYIANVVIE